MGDDDYVPFEGRTEVRSMTSTDGEMPPLQAETFDRAPADWRAVPPIGIHEMILRALLGRGAIETRWHNGIRQWRRGLQ